MTPRVFTSRGVVHRSPSQSTLSSQSCVCACLCASALCASCAALAASATVFFVKAVTFPPQDAATTPNDFYNNIYYYAYAVDPSILGQGTTIVKSVSAGLEHICYVYISTAGSTTQSVQCSGSNADGQITGTAELSTQSTGVSISGRPSTITNVVEVVAGGFHTCVLLTSPSGQVFCWGERAAGDVGASYVSGGSDVNGSPNMVPVSGSSGSGGLGDTSGVVQLAAGYQHTCALLANGGVYCWGQNDVNQLGDSSFIPNAVPVPVTITSAVITNAVQISAGYQHTCAILGNAPTQSVVCWGDNTFGQLTGVPDTTTSTTQQYVVDFGTATPIVEILSVSAGVGHTCVLLNDKTSAGVVQYGVVRCWGTDGTVGSEPNFGVSTFTSKIDIRYVDTVSSKSGVLTGVSEISAGFFATCVLLNNAGVECGCPCA